MNVLAAQLAYVEAARDRAKRTLPPKESSVEEGNYEFHVTIRAADEIAMAFSHVVFFQKPATVTECAERCVKAKTANKQNDRLIDALREEIEDLKHELSRVRGGKK